MKKVKMKQKISPDKFKKCMDKLCESEAIFTVTETYQYDNKNFKIAPPKKLFIVEIESQFSAN